jgi:hypothetical protein
VLFGYNPAYYTQRIILQKHFGKKVNLFLLLLFTVLLLNFSGCGEEENIVSAPQHSDNDLMETFTLINMESTTHKVTLSPKKLTFHDIDQSTIVINIFNTLSRDSSYELKALSTLQEKYTKDLFVVSLLIGDSINTATLQAFIKKNHISHYISNDIENQTFSHILLKSLSLDNNTTLPFSVLYNNGEYVIHYNNAIPVEMLSYDIKQSLKE